MKTLCIAAVLMLAVGCSSVKTDDGRVMGLLRNINHDPATGQARVDTTEFQQNTVTTIFSEFFDTVRYITAAVLPRGATLPD